MNQDPAATAPKTKARVNEAWVKALVHEAVKTLFPRGWDNLYHTDKSDVGTRDERYTDATARHAHDMIIKKCKDKGMSVVPTLTAVGVMCNE